MRIEGDSFGVRFLGGADFCVFMSVESARDEARRVLAAMPALTEFEIHEYRASGEWYNVAAGVKHGAR